MASMVSLTILGSTGSIGCSTLDVVRQNRDRYRVYSLVAGRNLAVLLSQIEEFQPKVVVVGDEVVKKELVASLAQSRLDPKRWPEMLAGPAARVQVSIAGEVNTVISAIVGVTGLEATYGAI